MSALQEAQHMVAFRMERHQQELATLAALQPVIDESQLACAVDWGTGSTLELTLPARGRAVLKLVGRCVQYGSRFANAGTPEGHAIVRDWLGITR